MKKIFFLFLLALSFVSAIAQTTETYEISTSTGTLTGGSNPSYEWVSNQIDLTMKATNDGGDAKNICYISDGTKLSLNAYNSNGGYYITTYTISVPQDGEYKIAGYNINAVAYKTVIVNGEKYADSNKVTVVKNDVNDYSVSFTVERNKDDRNSTSAAAIDIDAFTVTLQKVGGEEVEVPVTAEIDITKQYRLKDKSSNMYMLVSNYTNNQDGTSGGVKVAALDEDSDDQIFVFEESEAGYKLKTLSGYYISCAPLNVNAYSTDAQDGTVLVVETIDNAYLIKWDNKDMNGTNERDDYFKVQDHYVYCDAALGDAATWTFEEYIPVVKYTITASAGVGGRVSPEIQTVKQGNDATLVATANNGYEFVNWTLNGTEVSTDATYTINVQADAHYIAKFKPLPGKYYRIAYDFEVSVEDAVSTIAIKETDYSINNSTGQLNNASEKSSVWTSNETLGVALKITATDSNGKAVNTISNYTNNTYEPGHRYYAGGQFADGTGGSSSPTTYTLSVEDEGYIITGYSFEYIVSSANKITITDGYGYNETPARSWTKLTKSGLSTKYIVFNVAASSNATSYYIQTRDFTVTLQSESGVETVTKRFYLQSESCGISGKENALLMNEDNGASSIFYHVGNKLLSYKKGTYVKEDGNTRGLQVIGDNGGDVTITPKGETVSISAPNFMHPVAENNICYVDHCGATATCSEHDNFILEEVVSLPVTISAAGYATLYAPVAVTVPEGVTAHTITVNGEWATLSEALTVIPANTGVVLQGAEGTYDFAITTTNVELASDLSGSAAATYYTAAGTYYALGQIDGVVAFYKDAFNNNRFQNNSHKAYLFVAGSQNISFFGFRGEGTTAIENVEVVTEEVIFDLSGRRVSEIAAPGIYIVGGRKVLVK